MNTQRTKQLYSYVVIVHNSPELERESTLLDNKYKKSKKYAMIEKITHRDGSENISRIVYSSNLEELQNTASAYISWYNYPLGLRKNIQGYISEINFISQNNQNQNVNP